MLDKAWIIKTISKLDKKLSAKAVEYKDYIPYTTDADGKFTTRYDTDPGWWTNGFWGGLMWIMYQNTKNDVYRKTAEQSEVMLDCALSNYERLDHDNGFIWELTAGKSYSLTGNEESKKRLLFAADTLAGRYNIKGGYISAWNGKGRDGWAIIDCMMNLPLLYMASEIREHDRFKNIAMSHADKAMKYHVREDGSVNHILVYDTENGELLENLGGQGMEEGSSWSRGQSWAVYGFAQSYAYTKKTEYLNTAKKVAHYFTAAVCDDYIPKTDFRSPDEPYFVDTSAGMTAAAGMLEIAKHVTEYEKPMYIRNAYKMVRAIVEKYADWSDQTDCIITHGMESYGKGEQLSLIYSDYYFADALYRLKEFADNGNY